MKKIFLLLACAILTTTVSAQTSMTVNKKDGTKYTIALDNFTNATFGNDEETKPDTVTITDTVTVNPFGTTNKTIYFNLSSASTTEMTYIGGHLWKTNAKLAAGSTFLFQEDAEGSVVWGTTSDAAALSGTAKYGLTAGFTVGSDLADYYSVIFNDFNGSYALIKDAVRVLTFEDKDYKGSGNVAGNSDWSSLIDNPQYGGTWLYGPSGYGDATEYLWYDEANTELMWEGFKDTGMGYAFWSGGYAISNYYETDLSNGDYTHQLAIPLEQQDNNFCVLFQYVDNTDYGQGLNVKPIYFSDLEPRTIRSIDVINTTYTTNSLTNGDSFAPAASDNTDFVLVVRGYSALTSDNAIDETVYKDVEIPLCKGKDILKEWKTFDLTSLGKIVGMRLFTRDNNGDLSGEYGLNTPGYAAIDNIVVEF